MANGKRGRKKATDESFYLHVTEDVVVTKDTYNIIVSKIIRGENNEVVREQHLGYYARLRGLAEFLSTNGVDAESVAKFCERTRDFKLRHADGKVFVDAPKGFVFDERLMPVTAAA